MSNALQQSAAWRRALAYWWYAWGLSWCYWGLRTHDRLFFRAGIRSFSRAIRVWPDFAGAFYQRGLICGRELGEYQAAIDDLTRAISLHPVWPEPYLQRGLLQRFHGEPRTALEDLRHYLTIAESTEWRAEAERQIAMIEQDLLS